MRRAILSLPRILTIGSIAVFGLIAVFACFKKSKNSDNEKIFSAKPQTVQEVNLEKLTPATASVAEKVKPMPLSSSAETVRSNPSEGEKLPEGDRIDLLFVTDSSKLPLVETITYSSRVPWLAGRPAWIADYASHYETSRHFIARSLNRKTDYFTQKVSHGDRFNVLKKEVSFYLLIDLTRAKAWFYGIDESSHKRYLLKTYKVGLGRKDAKKISGSLTPLGKFQLGSKVAIYKPGTMGYFQDQQMEMIRVFGTRWMPFDKEIGGCSDGAKGYGIHGAPWLNNLENGKLVEDRDKIGKYESDGCIRLFSEDIEEIFAIVISKPTIVELVKDFKEAKLPGEEP
jgi:lipoprotein-anchoring transpeptidase ErfK/SrfK